MFRSTSWKWKKCLVCSYWKENKCVGSCPIQNIDYSALKINENLKQQLQAQITNTAEWYCYKYNY